MIQLGLKMNRVLIPYYNYMKSLKIMCCRFVRVLDDFRYRKIPQVPKMNKSSLNELENELKKICGEDKIVLTTFFGNM